MAVGKLVKDNINMEALAIGVDLGCTHIKTVVVNRRGEILSELREDTDEANDRHWKGTVVRMVKTLKQSFPGRVSAIGLSAPGLADEKNNCIEFMPGRLPGLENFNWSEAVGEHVYVLNDAHAALMAEAQFGMAKNRKHAILLTLGTGVGGGILIDGKLYQGVAQKAGHLGHATVNADDLLKDVTNMPGSLEDAFGNLTLHDRSNGKFSNTLDLVNAYKRDDPFAREIWLTSVRRLAVSIASFINILSPEVVILGGGISKAGDSLLEPLRTFMKEYEWCPGQPPTPIVFAQFSDLAGAMGAAAFAYSKLN
jgi:glucokinase